MLDSYRVAYDIFKTFCAQSDAPPCDYLKGYHTHDGEVTVHCVRRERTGDVCVTVKELSQQNI